MKKKIRIFSSIININLLIITLYLIYLNLTLPNHYNYIKGSDICINGKKYITININNKKYNNNYIQASNFNFNINHNNNDQERLAYQYDENCEALIKAYNILPIKQVDVKTVKPIKVYPCGKPFGIKMFTKGVMIVGMGEVDTGIIPSKNAGLKLGDMIISIDNIPVYNNDDIINIINKSNGKDVSIKVNRNNIEHIFKLTPKKSKIQNIYKAGMWVRNSTAGIGTLTFYTDEGYFGGLGHAVCDIDTGEVMPLLSGEIINVNINGVNKGKSGYPGELKCIFNGEEDIGLLTQNTATGVYGKLTDLSFIDKQKKIPVAMMQDITEGPAKILATIDDTGPQYFDIIIDKINYNHINPCKNMIIKITDEKLIKTTGGIVQGMSGSPIIQNGKIIGAVTHVFVNQPLKGYGIFAENMIKNLSFYNFNNYH